MAINMRQGRRRAVNDCAQNYYHRDSPLQAHGLTKPSSCSIMLPLDACRLACADARTVLQQVGMFDRV